MGRVGGFFYKEQPSREPSACSHCPPWLGGLSPRETLGAKPPRGDREERGGGPAVEVEGGYCWKGFPCPAAELGCCNLSACFLK